MWQVLSGIRVGAIGLAFFGCYILPTVIGWLILVTSVRTNNSFKRRHFVARLNSGVRRRGAKNVCFLITQVEGS
jgi:hypothetical protein